VSLCQTRKRGETCPGSSRSTQTLRTEIVTVSKGNRDCPNVTNVLLLQEQYGVSGDRGYLGAVMLRATLGGLEG
jgi:hypothetical protein